jgi:hypothetical protein
MDVLDHRCRPFPLGWSLKIVIQHKFELRKTALTEPVKNKPVKNIGGGPGWHRAHPLESQDAKVES